MKTNLTIVAIMLFTLCWSQAPSRVRAEIGPCLAGRTAATFGFWRWPANSNVNVYLRTPDFVESDASAVMLAMQRWDAAAIENGSNVHFDFRGMTNQTRTAPGDMTLIRNPVYGKKERHLALLEAHSLRGDQLIDWALVIVDPSVRNPEVLTNVMAHEIGHSLGLLDCHDCRSGTTAMGLLGGANKPNGIDGPTACDNAVVFAAYKELKLHVGRAPNIPNIKAADSDDEIEEDDTPIVEPPSASKPKVTASTKVGRADRP